MKPKIHTWEPFAVEHDLVQEYFYFDRHEVKEYTAETKVYWLRFDFFHGQTFPLGREFQKNQLELLKTAPRLSGKKGRQAQLFLMMRTATY
jgi:hypothetical protein